MRIFQCSKCNNYTSDKGIIEISGSSVLSNLDVLCLVCALGDIRFQNYQSHNIKVKSIYKHKLKDNI